MIKMYKANETNNIVEETTNLERGVWINLVNPTDEEINDICQNLKIEPEFVRYSLDYDERARIDIEDDVTLFVVDIPIIEKEDNGDLYTTIPLGIIVVRDDYFITVCLKKTKIVSDFENNKVKGFVPYKKTRFLLQILYINALYFLTYLKQINKGIEVTEKALQKSMKNKELIKLLTLEKSLVYFTTSLKSNEIIMEKILRGKIIKLYEEDEDILEDAIVENKQAIEMGKIYSDILAGTMDAYASIISNNLNIVMKFLASMTIVMSIPTIISSFFGMNVSVPFENNSLAFIIIICISVIIALAAGWWLKKKDMF